MLTEMDEAVDLSSTIEAHAVAAEPVPCESELCAVRGEFSDPIVSEAQRRWVARPLVERLQPLRKARHWIAAQPEVFAQAIAPELARSQTDTLVAEVLPLLEAMRFLERNAQKILAPRRLGGEGRPVWLAGVKAEVHRDALGHILVIGPANFPLFLPGVQVLQALVAGNAVTWKPGAGGAKVAVLLARALRDAGLPRGVLRVTDDSAEAAKVALSEHLDKVVFTGSSQTGRLILRELAATATPSTMELSGADAVIVLPSADLALTAKAVSFGLRLNGAEVCMSPRRLIGTRETLRALRPLLDAELATVPAVALKPQTADALQVLVRDALQQGAELSRDFHPDAQRPLLIDHVGSHMAVAGTDLFAPVLSLLEAPSVLHLADTVNRNPFGLTAAIFGNPREAQTLATQLRVGTVIINDLIAPTADPRVPFGGRGASGFGVTRGAEGLLEMTAAKVVLIRRKGTSRHYDPLGDHDLPLLAGVIGALHGGSLGQRWRSLKHVISAARSRRPSPRSC